MVPEKKGEHIVGTIIFGLFLIASPLYLMSDSSNFKFAPADDAKSAFWVAVAGIVLMVVGEITLFVLRKSLCGKLDEEGRKAVMGGYVMHAVGELDGEAPVEEAPAEEAPAEEAPVEEAPAEEAPAEEAPAEEAPVEEAPAEEAPVEEAPVEEAPAEETTEKQEV